MAVPKVNRILGTTENWFVYAGEYLIGSVLFGILMAAVIEFPVLRVRDHLFPSRGRPLTVSAPESSPKGKNVPASESADEIITLAEPAAVQLNYVPATSPGSLDIVARDPKKDR